MEPSKASNVIEFLIALNVLTALVGILVYNIYIDRSDVARYEKAFHAAIEVSSQRTPLISRILVFTGTGFFIAFGVAGLWLYQGRQRRVFLIGFIGVVLQFISIAMWNYACAVSVEDRTPPFTSFAACCALSTVFVSFSIVRLDIFGSYVSFKFSVLLGQALIQVGFPFLFVFERSGFGATLALSLGVVLAFGGYLVGRVWVANHSKVSVGLTEQSEEIQGLIHHG